MNTPTLTPDATGCRISVHVVPKASKSELAGLHGDAVRIRLNAPPVDGKANKALLAFIADLFDLPTRSVSLVAGDTSRQKIVHVSGVDLATAQRRLNLPPAP